MKLTAVPTGESGDSSRKIANWLRRTLRETSGISQSASAAGAVGIDFFDPSAVRAANREVLKRSAESFLAPVGCRKSNLELALCAMPSV